MEKLKQDHFFIGFLILVALASGGDLLVDLSHGSGLGHLLQEAVILFITLIILFGLIVEYRRKNQQLSLLQKESLFMTLLGYMLMLNKKDLE